MYLTLLALIGAICAYALKKRSSARLPYPPTPPGHFFLGNLRDMQHKTLRYRYKELAETYGEIFHLSALGQHIIVLNTEEAAYELFTRRSGIYSDRPQLAMVDLMGWDINFGFMGYGNRWRAHRRLFQQVMNPQSITQFRPIQAEKIHGYLSNLLTDPDNFSGHVETYVPPSCSEHYISESTQTPRFDRNENRIRPRSLRRQLEKRRPVLATLAATHNLTKAVLPGSWLVNNFPTLRHLPAWLPGCQFKRFAEETRAVVDTIIEEPYERAKSTMSDNPCLVTLLETSIAAGGHRNIEESYPKEICAVAYTVTSETSTAVIKTFYLAMRQNPSVQDKAYREIMSVVGSERLPDLTDRASLPYVEALYREVMRWMPPVPFSLPHCSTEDDVYKGYFIPKGSIVLPNLWAMMNNEQKYTSPRQFMPERFLSAEGKYNGGDIDAILGFGFGRRICAGRHFADTTIWLLFACILASFRIEKPEEGVLDEVDKLENVDDAFAHTTLVAHAAPFRCLIKPRSVEVVEVIRHLNMEN